MISIISIILIILIVIDFLLLTEWGKKWIWKLVKKKITERKEIADNLLMGLLAGLLVSGVVDDNKGIFILSVILILVFIIFRGFEYKKEKNK